MIVKYCGLTASSLPHFALRYDEGPGVRAERVVERDEDHGVGVDPLLRHHPLRAVGGVDPDHGVAPRRQSHGDQPRPEVGCSPDDLLVGAPLVGSPVVGPPAETETPAGVESPVTEYFIHSPAF